MSSFAAPGPVDGVAVASPYDSIPLVGPQGQRLLPTITHAMSDTTRLSGCVVVMPPGQASQPHLHERNDIIVVVIEGHAATLAGPELTPVLHGPGEFIFIAEGVPHVAVNLNTAHRLVAVEVRTDPSLNDDVTVLPEYAEQVERIVADLQQRFTARQIEVPIHWNIDDHAPFSFTEEAAMCTMATPE